jgi:hypothetical protein
MASFFVGAAAGQFELDTPDGIMKLLTGMAKKKRAMQVRYQHAQRRDNRRMAPPLKPWPTIGTASRSGVQRRGDAHRDRV